MTAVLALVQLPIEQLIPDPRNPRRVFDADELERLAASIKAQGIVEPLIVRKVADDPELFGTGKAKAPYVIVAGERRWRAAQLKAAGPLAAVPAIVRELNGASARAVQLVENDQRVELTAIEKAESYHRWLLPTGNAVTTVAGGKLVQKPQYKRTQAELAQAIGETEAHVSQVLALLALPIPARRLVEQGKITFAHARELGRLQEFPQAQAKMLQLIEERIRWGALFTTREWAERIGRELAGRKAAAARKAARAKQKGKGKRAPGPKVESWQEQQRRYDEERQRRDQARKLGLKAVGPLFRKDFDGGVVHKLVARIPRSLLGTIAAGLRLPSWGEDGEVVGVLKVGTSPARRVAAWLWLRPRLKRLNARVTTAGAAALKAAAVSARKAPPVRKGGRK